MNHSARAQERLLSLFRAALDAANPRTLLTADMLPDPPRGRTIVIGMGKPAAALAAGFEAVWPHACEGLVVTCYGYAVPTETIEIVEANHPVPDEASLDAGRRIAELVKSAGADDLIIALATGGGSALACVPANGITLADKQEMFRALLKSGAPIMEMNIVRRAMSAIKGGRLAAVAEPASVITYMLSDVPGDDPATIGGGTTILCPEDGAQALEVITRYGIPVAPGIKAAIGANRAPTSLAGKHERHMLATPKTALAAAATKAGELGMEVRNLGDLIEGEAREVAKDMAQIVRDRASPTGPGTAAPWVLLSGGETTVTLRGQGRGGRNTEFLLALALELDGAPGVYAIACDSDGIDGSEDNAGAIITPDILARARSKSLDGRAFLDNNDAYSFFEVLDALVVTGPTFTNVNDFRAIVVT
ncbi:MAG: glycerate kinase [Alphaproteobacteria bacterium]|nr:glycerate kinase [Alphaproteobacteria bacterium]